MGRLQPHQEYVPSLARDPVFHLLYVRQSLHPRILSTAEEAPAFRDVYPYSGESTVWYPPRLTAFTLPFHIDLEDYISATATSKRASSLHCAEIGIAHTP